MKPLLTCLLLIISLALQAKPLPLRFDTKIKADATARVTLPREIPEPEYVWVLVWMPQLLPAEDVLLTDGDKVELDNVNQQSEYAWKPFDELSGSSLLGLEEIENVEKILSNTDENLRNRLCRAINNNKFDLYTDSTNQKFLISSLEQGLYYRGLGGNKEEMFSDLSEAALFRQFKKLEKFWEEKNIWKYTCTDKDHPLFMHGEYSIIQYIAILMNFDLFFRLFQSGAYNLDLLNAPINSKNQTFFEWLEESIKENPVNFSQTKILAFEKFHAIMLKKYPELKEKSKLSITDN